MIKRSVRPALACLLVVGSLVGGACKSPSNQAQSSASKPEANRPVASPLPPTPPPFPARAKLPKSAEWPKLAKLLSEQKLEEAIALLLQIRQVAQQQQNGADWTAALAMEVRLMLEGNKYEQAARFLREQPWPPDGPSQVTLQLYYAHVLTTYLANYSYEVLTREKVVSTGVIDLRTWTQEQIYQEAQRAHSQLWQRRAELSQLPLDDFAEFLKPGTYPANIRGTLRDALSYLTVDLLFNSTLWTSQQLEGREQLDLKALLATKEPLPSSLSLEDATVHPLLKMVGVLSDLEAWHKQRGDSEAALEARLQRLARLSEAFDAKPDQELIRKSLETLLPEYRSWPWWAMGQAQLAQLYQTDPQDLARAREAAHQGATVFPDSLGGQRCRAIRARIEAPEYQLSAMRIDGLQQRSIQVKYRNLPHLYFRAYSLNLLAEIAASRDMDATPDADRVRKLLATSKPIAQWREELPKTPDYQQHQAYVTPPLQKEGAYVVAASVLSDFSEEHNLRTSVTLLLSNLVMRTSENGTKVNVTVVSGKTGLPIPDVQVSLYQNDWGRPPQRTQSKTTNASGVVTLTGGEHMHYVLAQKGSSISLDPHQLYLSPSVREDESTEALIFTDRSIYRPGQRVHWKVVAYHGHRQEGRVAVAAKRSFSVELFDGSGNSVEKQRVTTNGFGSAAGSFVIPNGRLLGNWYVSSQPFYGRARIKVEEYKRPTFEVSLKDAKEQLRLNQPARLSGEAHYYFGLPVTTGKVKWLVKRAPVFPRSWDWRWHEESSNEGAQTVASGSSELAADGTFALQFTPTADKRKRKEVRYSYAISADLTDDGGETRSATRTYQLGFVALQARILSDDGFLPAQSAQKMSILRSSLDGAPLAGKGSYKLVALAQPTATLLPFEQPILQAPTDSPSEVSVRTVTPGDKLRPRAPERWNPEAVLATWADGNPLKQGELTHNEKGIAELSIPPLPAGAYRVRYQTVDAFGNPAEATHDFVVGDKATPLNLPLFAKLAQEHVTVGKSAKLLVASGLRSPATFVDRYRGSDLIERRLLTDADHGVLLFPVTEKDRGDFHIVVWAVRNHEQVEQTLVIRVPWDNKELSVAFSTFRDKLQPGGKETWRVTVRDKTSNSPVLGKGAVELLAYMYDRSLDLFAAHTPPSVASIYPERYSFENAHVCLQQLDGAAVGEDKLQNLPSEPEPLVPAHLVLREGNPVTGIASIFARDSALGRGELTGISGPLGSGPPAASRHRAAFGKAAAGRSLAVPDAEAKFDVAKNKATQPVVPEPKEKTTFAQIPTPDSQPVRSDFSESAFFYPQLITDAEGVAELQFTVPDSVTSWSVWVHALTQDLRGGSVEQEARSVKELMVRPYLPRFFREGDQADLKVVVNNAGDKLLSGSVKLDILDSQTEESVLQKFAVNKAELSFSIAAGKSSTLTIPLTAPRQVGTYAFRVTAKAGDVGDGELRPVPVLPSRLHLTQSRFVSLRNQDSRTMTFADLKQTDDASRVNEQLVVTLDTQLFYTVLNALPYLVEYPYECSEQTLNRFLATGISSSLYEKYPAVAKMAKQLSSRKSELAGFGASEPTRKITLEETPWLQSAKGEQSAESRLINVLDPRIARAQRDSALGKLRKLQDASGGFAWFSGGPASPFMTLYLLHGFAKGAEFGVPIPEGMAERGWQYLRDHYSKELAAKLSKADENIEFLTLLNYVASTYERQKKAVTTLLPSERKLILAHSFAHWQKLSLQLRAMLALTLKRVGRASDAQLVWASVINAAKTEPDQGTFWAPEERSWLWYHDTIESHAFALRALMELDPQNPKKEGLVLWLLLNKKLNQWKSTRATAEVLYSLAYYLRAENALAVREQVQVRIGTKQEDFTFEPDHFAGKTQIVVPGAQIVPASSSSITVQKATKGVMFASASWSFSTEKLPTEARSDFFEVSRSYFLRSHNGKEFTLKPLAEGTTLHPGDQVEVQLSLRSKQPAEYVHLRDPRAAGLEPEAATSHYSWDYGPGVYEEYRDSGTNFFFESLPAGQYTFRYRLRANLAGQFRIGPATVQSIYAPEFSAYSSGYNLSITETK